MKRTPLLSLAGLVFPLALAAQQPAAPAMSSKPVTEAAQRNGARLAGFLTAAADAIPADKLSYKPTPAQMTIGEVWNHLAEANYGLCAGIGGTPAPTLPKRTGSEPKDSLVTTLKASFAFCDATFAKTDDSNLGQQLTFPFGSFTRASAMIIYVADLADHYSQIANYMRLNGMTPPSAQARPRAP
jgi:hypothetical protein